MVKSSTIFIVALLLSLSSASHFYSLVDTISNNTEDVNGLQFIGDSYNFLVAQHSGQGFLCTNINNSITMTNIVSNETIGHIFQMKSTADGSWMILCSKGGYVQVLERNSTNEYEVKQTISGLGTASKTCDITDDHQFIAYNTP